MSIYKGGYILADISDTELSSSAQDLLTKDLKDYISKYFDANSGFNKEILIKPIKLLVNIADFKCLVEFNSISDDGSELHGLALNYDTLYRVQIVIDGATPSIMCNTIE